LAQHALTKMSLGGIHDHLGGGFPHYAVDAAWRIPHFEKMLYDNALLARICLEAWKAIADPNHLAVVEDALGFMLAELRWFQISREPATGILDHLIDPAGGFFDTPADHEALIARHKSLQDTPIPSGSSLATALLLQLSYLEENPDFQPPAERALSRMAGLAAEHPTAFAAWMNALDFALAPSIQWALIGEPDEGALQDLAQAADEIYFPNMVRAAAGEYRKNQDPALLRNRTLLDGKPAAYLCRGFTCQRPTASPDELRRLLEAEIQPHVGSF